MDLNQRIEERRKQLLMEQRLAEQQLKEQQRQEALDRAAKEAVVREEVEKRLEQGGYRKWADDHEVKQRIERETERALNDLAAERLTRFERWNFWFWFVLGVVLLFSVFPIGVTMISCSFWYRGSKKKKHRAAMDKEVSAARAEQPVVQVVPVAAPVWAQSSLGAAPGSVVRRFKEECRAEMGGAAEHGKDGSASGGA